MNIQLALNQQFQQGCFAAQQGMLAEQVGNWPMAAQCYDQSIAVIGNSIAVAGQYGVPVLDNVFATYAVCNFQAARAKAAAGYGQFASAHLGVALQAINQAAAMRPDVPQYQAAAAFLQSAQSGSLPAQNVAFAPHLSAGGSHESTASGKATQKQWVELATSALNAMNTFGGMLQQGGQNNDGGDGWSQWNQGGGWSQNAWG